ncbi:ATP-grasp domain-containing protein [Lentzea sp. NPDC060358]|uniref:ATP-grasp domain-containing protein n=1 Tax=Lentzea sp. NPDC060358 TaxID=3347103 RepID=UPI003659C509
MRPLIVVYDEGSVAPSEIAVGLAEVSPCVFAVGPTPHARAMEPLLEQFGPVVRVESAVTAAEQLAAHSPRGIVTFSERALPVTAELAERLGLPGNSRATVARLTDKWLQRSALRAAGVDTVRSYRIAAEQDWEPAVGEVGLPAVLKPANGGASRNTYLVEDGATGLGEVRRLLAQDAAGFVPGGALVLEEYLRGRPSAPFGDYVSVENLTVDGHVLDVAVTGKLPLLPPFRESGYFVPAPLQAGEEAEVRTLARAAITALGVSSGFTHTEVKLTGQGPRLIEVNGRLGAGVHDLVGRAHGVDAVTLAGRVALGERVVLDHPRARRVYFQIFHPAPRRPCELVAVEGAREVRELPGVTVHRPFLRPGTAIAGGVQTERLGVVTGEAGDSDELAGLVREVNARLRYRFAFAGSPETRSVSAAELGEL